MSRSTVFTVCSPCRPHPHTEAPYATGSWLGRAAPSPFLSAIRQSERWMPRRGRGSTSVLPRLAVWGEGRGSHRTRSAGVLAAAHALQDRNEPPLIPDPVQPKRTDGGTPPSTHHSPRCERTMA